MGFGDWVSNAWDEVTDLDNYKAAGTAIVDGVVDGAVGTYNAGVAVKDWTVDTAYPWVADTAVPAVGNGIAYAGAGVVAGAENLVIAVPNASRALWNGGAAALDYMGLENDASVPYIENPNILGWDRVDEAHEFYDYVGDNPGRAAALGTQGAINAVTSVGGSIVGLGTDVVRGVWNTGEILVVDGVWNGVIINGGKAVVNLGLDDDEDFAYTELQGAERYDGVFKATIGIPKFLNDWTQIQDAMPDHSAAYYAFQRPEMEITVDASTLEFSADPDGAYIKNPEGEYVLAPEDDNGERNGEYSISSFDIIRSHENPRQIFIGTDGEVVEGIHSAGDNPQTILVDADGDAIDILSEPRQFAVGPDGERIEGPNPAEIMGDDGEAIANPDYIVPTMVANPIYEGSREIANPDYVEGEFVDNPDYKEVSIVNNPYYGYERGITYGAQAAVEVPLFVLMTVGTGGTVGAALASGRAVAAKGATLVDEAVIAVKAVIATPADEAIRGGAEAVVAGGDEAVRVAAETTTTTANTVGSTTSAGQQVIDDAILAAEGVAKQPAAGVAAGTNTTTATATNTGANAANATAAGSTGSTTTALESVRGANLARDAVEISEQTWKPWRPFSTQSRREARVDGIVNGERAGAAGENLPGMRGLTGARAITETDFLQHIARNVTATPESFLGRLWAQTGGRLPVISRPSYELHRAQSRLDGLVARGASPERITRAEQAVTRATEKVEEAVERAVTQWNQIAQRNPNIASVTTEEALAATQRLRALSTGQQIIDSAAVGAHSTGRFMSPGRGLVFEVAGGGGAFALGYYGDKANAESIIQAGQDIAGQSAASTLEQRSQTDLDELARLADQIIAEEEAGSTADAFNNGSAPAITDTSPTADAFNGGAMNTPRPGAANTLQLNMGGVVINVEDFDEKAKAGAILGAQKY